MSAELLPSQRALAILFQLLPTSANGMMGIFLKAFQAQSKTMYKALATDTRLQAELDQLFIKAKNELARIYPDEKY
jgi:hypothetical protein